MLFINKIKNFINTKKILSEEEFKISISKGFRYEVSKNKLKHDIEQIGYLFFNMTIGQIISFLFLLIGIYLAITKYDFKKKS